MCLHERYCARDLRWGSFPAVWTFCFFLQQRILIGIGLFPYQVSSLSFCFFSITCEGQGGKNTGPSWEGCSERQHAVCFSNPAPQLQPFLIRTKLDGRQKHTRREQQAPPSGVIVWARSGGRSTAIVTLYRGWYLARCAAFDGRKPSFWFDFNKTKWTAMVWGLFFGICVCAFPSNDCIALFFCNVGNMANFTTHFLFMCHLVKFSMSFGTHLSQ